MVNSTKILLLGCSGQLGQMLYPLLLNKGRVIVPDRSVCDFGSTDQVMQLLNQVKPDVIVNAAAYTAVDLAETEHALVFQINASIPGVLAQWAEKQGAFLMHYSTDYVFDGMKHQPYTEQDQGNPLNQYGASKLAGEKAIQEATEQFLILRTGWLYSQYRHNFLKTLVRSLQTKPALHVISDQIGTPTYALGLAHVSCELLQYWQQQKEDFPSGIYHMVAQGETSWYAYALLIAQELRRAGLTVMARTIEPVSSDAYGLAARRPRYSVLNTQKLQRTFNLVLPHWQSEVEGMLRSFLR